MGAVSGSEGTSETSYSSNLSVLGQKKHLTILPIWWTGWIRRRASQPVYGYATGMFSSRGKVSPKPLGGAQTDGPRCPTNLLKRRLRRAG